MKKILSILVLVILMVLTASTTVGASEINIDWSKTEEGMQYNSWQKPVSGKTNYTISLKTATGGDRDPDGAFGIVIYGNKEIYPGDNTHQTSLTLPRGSDNKKVKSGSLMTYNLNNFPDLGKITGFDVYYNDTTWFYHYDWNAEYIELDGKRFYVNRTICDQTVKVRFNSSGGYSMSIDDEILDSGSIFSSPAIWFIIGGGVLFLVAGALVTIFALRKKKAKLALLATKASTVDTPISDSSEDKLNL